MKCQKSKKYFQLKKQNPHPSCVISEGVCPCNMSYVGDTKRIASIRFSEHDNPNKQSEPARHLKENLSHNFAWIIICSAPTKWKPRNNLEKIIIALKRPPLNDQIKTEKLRLFRNGIT